MYTTNIHIHQYSIYININAMEKARDEAKEELLTSVECNISSQNSKKERTAFEHTMYMYLSQFYRVFVTEYSQLFNHPLVLYAQKKHALKRYMYVYIVHVLLTNDTQMQCIATDLRGTLSSQPSQLLLTGGISVHDRENRNTIKSPAPLHVHCIIIG